MDDVCKVLHSASLDLVPLFGTRIARVPVPTAGKCCWSAAFRKTGGDRGV